MTTGPTAAASTTWDSAPSPSPDPATASRGSATPTASPSTAPSSAPATPLAAPSSAATAGAAPQGSRGEDLANTGAAGISAIAGTGVLAIAGGLLALRRRRAGAQWG
ncbi:LPXTG cell wall anchor domain-containing protein [Streptomyces sp. NBC_00453]